MERKNILGWAGLSIGDPRTAGRAIRPRAAPAFLAAAAAIATLCLASACALLSCSPADGPLPLPQTDLSPPLALEAGTTGERSFVIRFDEDVKAIEGSFSLEPGPELPEVLIEGSRLELRFAQEQSPGAGYRVGGEVEDGHGNRTSFLYSFLGWNGRPPRLRLSEVVTAKNSSTTKPHRDYVEFVAKTEGNLGGVELRWASSTKSYVYHFPGAEVAAGEYIVLHLAPQGLAVETDETGSDLGLSGGIDASTAARDFWSPVGALPDESGIIALGSQPGSVPADGLFYADESKVGPLGEDKLSVLVAELVVSGVWPSIAASAAWEDAFRWKPSSSKSINRAAEGSGGAAWYLSVSGGQTPGVANGGP